MANTFETTIGGVSTTIDLDSAYTNLMGASKSFEDLTVAIAFIMGLVMIVRGLGMYRAFGQHITQMSRHGELAGPAVYIVVGAFLLYLPTMIDATLQTTFAVDRTDLTQLQYTGTTTSTIDWDKVLELVTAYARLVGLIAFVRGLNLVSKAGDPGVQPGTITRGLVHFVAGVLLINIGATYAVLSYTFGMTVAGVSVG